MAEMETMIRMNQYADALNEFIETAPASRKAALVTEWTEVMEWLTANFKYRMFNPSTKTTN